jgi:hypothetical protein
LTWARDRAAALDTRFPALLRPDVVRPGPPGDLWWLRHPAPLRHPATAAEFAGNDIHGGVRTTGRKAAAQVTPIPARRRGRPCSTDAACRCGHSGSLAGDRLAVGAGSAAWAGRRPGAAWWLPASNQARLAFYFSESGLLQRERAQGPGMRGSSADNTKSIVSTSSRAWVHLYRRKGRRLTPFGDPPEQMLSVTGGGRTRACRADQACEAGLIGSR